MFEFFMGFLLKLPDVPHCGIVRLIFVIVVLEGVVAWVFWIHRPCSCREIKPQLLWQHYVKEMLCIVVGFG